MPSPTIGLQKYHAQVAIDTVWMLLDSPSEFSIAHHSKYYLRQLALKLAIAHNVLPPSLKLTGVERKDSEHRVEGGFAAIFYGTFNGGPVAIKRLSVFLKTTGETRDQLKQASLVHKHVLPFLGASEDIFCNTICIVLPWMDNGRIRDYIVKLRSEEKLIGADFAPAIIRWLRQLALGLEYLHRENVVHGDLHGGNILVDKAGDIKLTDFGMSVTADGTPYNYGSVHGGGAVRWTAPELIEPEEFGLPNRRPTFQSDVYSFACVCIELYSLRPPWNDLQRDYQVIKKVVDRERPARPTLPEGGKVADDMWALISACWSHHPQQRPSARTLVYQLTATTSHGADNLDHQSDRSSLVFDHYVPKIISRQQVIQSEQRNKESLLCSPSHIPTSLPVTGIFKHSPDAIKGPLRSRKPHTFLDVAEASLASRAKYTANPRSLASSSYHLEPLSVRLDVANPNVHGSTISPCHDSLYQDKLLSTFDVDALTDDANLSSDSYDASALREQRKAGRIHECGLPSHGVAPFSPPTLMQGTTSSSTTPWSASVAASSTLSASSSLSMPDKAGQRQRTESRALEELFRQKRKDAPQQEEQHDSDELSSWEIIEPWSPAAPQQPLPSLRVPLPLTTSFSFSRKSGQTLSYSQFDVLPFAGSSKSTVN
ncbi:hypothetical protein EIP91_000248 [Steccherinum ochraceum]|uniref:Protein kinase domain-containing protein n=1 Tax=Steccherinum ochraceum TaxID=92696 RepID=A0A4V2MWS2_9APHY|nr:hypothetical protein EIP91_000248 [Steccherinum ochraceum]